MGNMRLTFPDLFLSILLLIFDLLILIYFIPYALKARVKEAIHQLFSNIKFNTATSLQFFNQEQPILELHSATKWIYNDEFIKS